MEGIEKESFLEVVHLPVKGLESFNWIRYMFKLQEVEDKVLL